MHLPDCCVLEVVKKVLSSKTMMSGLRLVDGVSATMSLMRALMPSARCVSTTFSAVMCISFGGWAILVAA